MMMQLAEDKPTRQFIFFTPQDMRYTMCKIYYIHYNYYDFGSESIALHEVRVNLSTCYINTLQNCFMYAYLVAVNIHLAVQWESLVARW